MSVESEFERLRERLAGFAKGFNERNKEGVGSTPGGGGTRVLGSAYWSIKELLTRDVTREGLRDLVDREARETYRFLTRHLDFVKLSGRPWYIRYPGIVWLVFLSLAYRLSPPRRVAFAFAIFALLLALLISLPAATGSSANTGLFWWLIGSALLFFLLLLELRDKLDLKGDLEIAREIQFGLVPGGPFQLGGIGIRCFMRPANTVGGDYYDVIELGGRQVAVVVGDVAGKGMPAALLMALLQGSLRTLITAGFRGPEVVGKLNDYLYASIPDNSLVTLFYGELDTETGRLRYVNAGHNAPLLMRSAGACERLPATATVLGFQPGLPFNAAETAVGVGERLFLYTDGVTEAFNTSEEEFGEGRLEAYLDANRSLGSDPLIQGLVRDVLAFCGAERPRDDITLVAVDRAAPAA
jgi:serine phosphatase RsbU (regulator of sigma subunit)